MPTFSWNPAGNYYYPDPNGSYSFGSAAEADAAQGPQAGSDASGNPTYSTNQGNQITTQFLSGSAGDPAQLATYQQQFGAAQAAQQATQQATQEQQATQQAANAANFGIISQFFQSIGITDPSALAWAQGLLTSGAGVAQVEVQMYDQPWFQARFPEIGLAQKNGLPPISPQDVLNYEQTASQVEQQVGLPQGFIGKDEITQLMGTYNVSPAELTDRLVQGYAVANQQASSVPQVAQALKDYYNVGPGGLAAYWLDPTKALAQLQKQFSAAQIGASAGITGFGSVDRGTAEQLAGLGVTQTQAQQGFAQLAHLRQAYNPLPGESGGGVSQASQVAGQFEGNARAQLAMQLAAQTRQAAFAGQGSFSGDQGGAHGLGAAVPNVP